MTRRTLVLLRHSKADRPAGVPDADRPLTRRGHEDAAAAGHWLATNGYLPDAVICSPARRTRQTWHGVAVAMAAGPTAAPGSAPEVHYAPAAYGGGPADLLALVRALGPAVASALVIGHNPAISQLSTMLDPVGLADSDGLRTSGIVAHRIDGDWADLTQGAAPVLDTHTARG